DQAFQLIQQARRPIILAGNGTIRKRASKQMRRFCERTGIGVVSTFMAKGSVDMDADYCLFTVGLQTKDLITCAIDAADLVMTVGYDMVEYHPRLWNPAKDKRIIHIDFLPTEIDAHYQPEVELVGDVALTLSMLNERVEAHDGLRFDLEQQASTRRLMLQDFAEHKDDATEGLIRPQKAVWDARRVMGRGDILLSDVGAHKMWIARYYHCHEPNSCLIPNGFCSMGFALPGAIAAKLVHPDRRVLAICGDGGFLMNVQEMETAARLGTPIVVMVWVDGGYGLISWKQDNEFGRHTDLSFNNPDFVQLAESFGWIGQQVDRSAELQSALEQAFANDRPTLLAVPIDYRENPKLTERLGNIVCPI
ncbi:MAG: thiamine pyrophosphate-dependent enzyme, partial [Phycisphaeraceae bacterium]